MHLENINNLDNEILRIITILWSGQYPVRRCFRPGAVGGPYTFI